jgi:hypothetical protein
MWRFFQNEQGKWKWQKIGMDREIIDEAMLGFHDYASCMNDAVACGYQYSPSQPCSVKARFAPVTVF